MNMTSTGIRIAARIRIQNSKFYFAHFYRGYVPSPQCVYSTLYPVPNYVAKTSRKKTDSMKSDLDTWTNSLLFYLFIYDKLATSVVLKVTLIWMIGELRLTSEQRKKLRNRPDKDDHWT